jgi:thiol-disulfide isomerase/thioredoxin
MPAFVPICLWSIVSIALAADPAPAPPPLGSPAPEWSIVQWTDGRSRKLSDYRGKVVVLHFWGAWCSDCLNGLPACKKLQARYAGNPHIVFLGIHSAGTDMAQIKMLMHSREWTLPTGLDRGSDPVDGVTTRSYGVHHWPARVIVDRRGAIVYSSDLDQPDAEQAALEQMETAQALGLPALKSGASAQERAAWANAINVHRYSQRIDQVLAGKTPL